VGSSNSDQQTVIEYTNSLEGALEDAKEHVAEITADQDRMMEKINEQQKLMMEQQQKFMEMMMSARVVKPAKADGEAKTRGNPGKMVVPRNCGVCGKVGVCHLDVNCWEDDRSVDKRPKWYPKNKSKE